MIFRSCESQRCVVGSKEDAPRIRFWGLNDPRDISNNLALGQPWSSELETIDTTKIVNYLGIPCAVIFMGFVL